MAARWNRCTAPAGMKTSPSIAWKTFEPPASLSEARDNASLLGHGLPGSRGARGTVATGQTDDDRRGNAGNISFSRALLPFFRAVVHSIDRGHFLRAERISRAER